jgi:ATP-binding cassette, subfamily A (ABC1), member 3
LVDARKNIGYCPQFDALSDNLTSREHLELYAAIKGIPKDKREQLISKKIKEMNLTEFEHIPAGTYSGGNKRKLSVAIAMLGNPSIVFLDEPSTGMDPQARRFMWNVISRIATKRKQSSIILTTHSMEEAEYLSTRIAIQAEGMIKCIGSV